MSTIEWTPERTNALMALWDEGLSTAEIGRRLGVTKNAVVGKVHRLGLPKRGSPINQERTRTPRTSTPRAPAQRRAAPAAVHTKPKSAVPAVVVPVAPRKPAKLVSLSGLTSDMCSWPIGDPTSEDFAFCGHEAVPGKPYCLEHCGMAYVKVSRDRSKDSQAA